MTLYGVPLWGGEGAVQAWIYVAYSWAVIFGALWVERRYLRWRDGSDE
jgi:hypothetical protein